MQNIKIYNAHCCGEIGDVIVESSFNLQGETILEQSQYLLENKKLRNFILNEPRGGVFKHCNLIVPPKNKKALSGFIIMEPEDNPPMSGSNSICVATVLLEKNLIPMQEPITKFFLEAPGGLVKVEAECSHNKIKAIKIENLPSYVHKFEETIEVEEFGSVTVSTVFGGDSFVICNASDFNLSIHPSFAKDFVRTSSKILRAANEQLGFFHPKLKKLNFISFCQFVEPVFLNDRGIKEAKNTVCIRPGKLDRSPCGTGSSARLALMRAKKEIDINENFISKSIIGSEFICKIENEFIENNIRYIVPSIKGSAFITGQQELYVSSDDPFPEGYKLNDTWPQNIL